MAEDDSQVSTELRQKELSTRYPRLGQEDLCFVTYFYLVTGQTPFLNAINCRSELIISKGQYSLVQTQWPPFNDLYVLIGDIVVQISKLQILSIILLQFCNHP